MTRMVRARKPGEANEDAGAKPAPCRPCPPAGRDEQSRGLAALTENAREVSDLRGLGACNQDEDAEQFGSAWDVSVFPSHPSEAPAATHAKW